MVAFEDQVEIREGGVAVGDEVRGSREPFGQHGGGHGGAADFRPPGSSWVRPANIGRLQAFCSVVRREGSCLGSDATTERMFAWWSGCVSVTVRLAPLARDGVGGLSAANVGLKARLSHAPPRTGSMLRGGRERGRERESVESGPQSSG